MLQKNAKFLEQVADYYSNKLAQHGETARGVDWNGDESQVLRFSQLCKLIDKPDNFSVNDLGCGYGALYEHLSGVFKSFSYLGIDVSEKMVEAAAKRHQDPQARFVFGSAPDQVADYGIASGIFNVRLGKTDDEWWAYLIDTLETLDRTSRLGFSFNCLTSYSDADRMVDHLYYADPCKIFDLCKRRFSRNVALLHDYDLYEFSVLVRKQG